MNVSYKYPIARYFSMKIHNLYIIYVYLSIYVNIKYIIETVQARLHINI